MADSNFPRNIKNGLKRPPFSQKNKRGSKGTPLPWRGLRGSAPSLFISKRGKDRGDQKKIAEGDHETIANGGAHVDIVGRHESEEDRKR